METQLETYFKKFRNQVVGIGKEFQSPYGTKEVIYADWTASGRLYRPIEDKILHDIAPFVANTHTETSTTGAAMTLAYKKARTIIKSHVNASENDVLITEGSGMTGVVNKFQRILGLKVSENLKEYTTIPEDERPIVLVTHMEHHSNQTSWLETIADVEVVPSNELGLVCLEKFEKCLQKHQHRKLKIASITSCSNVTGIETPYHEVAKLIHKYNGLCFVDFACSAPYVDIDMHPEDEAEHLDAIFFSPHKFLGGPGSSGALLFNKKLYKNLVPDNPGGGTVLYTNPWGDHDYIDDVEIREDGGTPGFLQTIRIALAIQLKEEIGVKNIHDREEEINAIVFNHLTAIPNLNILAENNRNRLGIYSFYITDVHYNLIVKLLNDRYGIQTRGGCSCAGTYGHFLLNVDQITSKSIEDEILLGNLFIRPGWVRMSIHPTMTNKEIEFICLAIAQVAENYKVWRDDYVFIKEKNDYVHKSGGTIENQLVKGWFNR